MLTGYIRNGRLVGVVGLNCPRAMLHWTAELERQLPVGRPGTRNGSVPVQRGSGARTQPVVKNLDMSTTEFREPTVDPGARMGL